MPIVVSDTSPLRALAHLGLLDLLKTMFGEVYVPPGVVAELQIPRRRFPALDLSGLASIRVQAPADAILVTELLRELDLGESQAIALALELEATTLLMDEAAGRGEAKRRGLNVTGVLGVLRDAKLTGLVPAVKPLIDGLINDLGFFVLDALRTQILNDCGELA
jgi:predicted nucleic acid-binding protein